MIKLSKRLQAIADLIDKEDRVVDVGCDHGLLDLYLVDHGIKVIASDINDNALNQLRNNITKYHSKDIDLRKGDGLETVKKDEINTVVLAGMGTETIVKIIDNSRDKIKSVNKVITQSNNDNISLRKKMCKQGFYICKEFVVYERKHYYTIIEFLKGYRFYTFKDYFLGPYLRKNKTNEYANMLKVIYNKNIKIISSIKDKKDIQGLVRQNKLIINAIKNDI